MTLPWFDSAGVHAEIGKLLAAHDAHVASQKPTAPPATFCTVHNERATSGD